MQRRLATASAYATRVGRRERIFAIRASLATLVRRVPHARRVTTVSVVMAYRETALAPVMLALLCPTAALARLIITDRTARLVLRVCMASVLMV